MKFRSINLLTTFLLPCLLTLTSFPVEAQSFPTNGPGGTTRGPNGEYFPTGGRVQPMPPPTRGPNGEYFPTTPGVDNRGIPTQGPGGTTRGPNGEIFPGTGPSGSRTSRSGNNIDWNELTKASTNPIVFLVNGFGGCDPCIAPYLYDKLKAQGIPVYDLDWNDIDRRKQSTNFDLSDANFLQQMDSVISKINPSRPIVLIGHSFGGDSVLKVAQRVAPRKIAFLGVLDAVELGGIRTGRSVGSNVRYFYNRWTKNPSELQRIKGIPIEPI